MVNCFIGFGTFAAKPFINIHDIIVKDKFRGQGIGRKLLEEVKQRAVSMDCAKITLEVREDNHKAQRLYQSMGYADCKPAMRFWTCNI